MDGQRGYRPHNGLKVLKRLTIYALALLTVFSCQKELPDTPSQEVFFQKEIEFAVEEEATKVEEVGNVPEEIRVSMARLQSNSDVACWTNEKFRTKDGVKKHYNSSGTYDPYYWPSDPETEYDFFASNVTLAAASSGGTVSVDGINTDVICASCLKVKNTSSPSLAFKHILARVIGVTFSDQSDKNYTNPSLSMKYCDKGTYNIKTDTWSSLGTLKTTTFSGSTSTDFWIVPGTYELTFSFVDAAGNSISKRANMTFMAGIKHKINCKIGLCGDVVISFEEYYSSPYFDVSAVNVPASGGYLTNPEVSEVYQDRYAYYTYADGSIFDDSVYGFEVLPGEYSVMYSLTGEDGPWTSTVSTEHISSLGTTVKGVSPVTTVYVKVTGFGNQSSVQEVEVYQEANRKERPAELKIEPWQPDNTWIGVTNETDPNWVTCPATGGYVMSKGYAKYLFTSGAVSQNFELVTNDVRKYSAENLGFSLVWSEGYGGQNPWITDHTGGNHINAQATGVTSPRQSTATWKYTASGVNISSNSKLLKQAGYFSFGGDDQDPGSGEGGEF